MLARTTPDGPLDTSEGDCAGARQGGTGATAQGGTTGIMLARRSLSRLKIQPRK